MNLEQLQQAVYDRLTSQVGGSVVGIYTKAPQASQSENNAAFPYITVGPVIATPSDDKDANGIMALVDVHIWSRSQSALVWRAIGDDVYAALQKYTALAVTGANVIDCRFDNSVDYQDPEDGRTWHYVQTYRVLYHLT